MFLSSIYNCTGGYLYVELRYIRNKQRDDGWKRTEIMKLYKTTNRENKVEEKIVTKIISYCWKRGAAYFGKITPVYK